jgi:hypothetical protein
MSKPLELTVYPRLERPNTGAEIMPYREQWRREEALKQSKHLTDAELAAEYHHQGHVFMLNGSTRAPDAQRQAAIWDALHRFATIPHYDEPTA